MAHLSLIEVARQVPKGFFKIKAQATGDQLALYVRHRDQTPTWVTLDNAHLVTPYLNSG